MLLQYSTILYCMAAETDIKLVHKISDANILVVCPQYLAIMVIKSALIFLNKVYLYNPNYH